MEYPLAVILFAAALIALFTVPKDRRTVGPLERTNMASWRGILAVLIVFHHLAYHGFILAGAPWFIIKIFINLGVAVVAVFFFFSGYGLMVSASRPDYFDGFLPRRIGSYLPLQIFLILMTMAFIMLLGDGGIIGRILAFLKNGYTIVPNTWFLYPLTAFYILFFLCRRLISRPQLFAAMILAGTMAMYVLFRFVLEYSWFTSLIGFPMGIYCGLYHRQIQNFLKRRCTLLVISFAIMAAVLAVGMEYSDKVLTLGHNVLIVFSVVAFVALMSLVDLSRSRLWTFLGKISLEIYLLHGLVMLAIIDLRPAWIRVPLIFAITIVLAYIVNRRPRLTRILARA